MPDRPEPDDALDGPGVSLLRGPFPRVADAWRAAEAVVSAHTTAGERLEVIGDFALPAPTGPPSRDFQTLHFDFGLPLVPAGSADIARFTALYVHSGETHSEAMTRLVPLRTLLAARDWPDRDDLIRRWTGYGISHGAWAGSAGYVEGSLARVIEAASGEAPELPSVTRDPGFLCGTEFDNLTVAHGRRGRRRPGELHQRVFGQRRAPIARQREVRERILAAFAG